MSMAKMRPALPLLLLLLLFLFSPSAAEIKSLTINSDSRPMILLEKFGFTHKGHVSIAVSSVSVGVLSSSVQPESSRLGFFLLNEEALLQVLMEIQQNPSFCVLDSHYILLLFTFRDLSPPPFASFNRSYPVTSPNEYSLFFANCAPETSVSMSLHTESYNLDSDSSRDYLSAGQTHLPSLYFLFFLTYLSFFSLWLYIYFSNKLSVHPIHLLMSLLLLVKALNLICAAEDKHYVKVSGLPHGWDVLFYIFQFIRVVLLFTVIVLIGSGQFGFRCDRGNRTFHQRLGYLESDFLACGYYLLLCHYFPYCMVH
uniref:CAND6/7 N-terminal domain-containing protein n=1 Tax=Glycine max TaxID=3847 RepID=A0A0R0EPP2_SOYBN